MKNGQWRAIIFAPLKSSRFMSKAPFQPPAEASGDPKRRVYTDEFKQDVIRLITDEDYSIRGAAKAVGVCEQTVRNWYHKLAPKPEPIGEDASVEQLKAEVKRLTKELKRAEMERDILEKATAYFAKDQL
ncbi:transposase [Rubinisphaera italica]|uniref:Transposase n=1 Tax=Rubinisphaera italica TaxID=2527969 RepID=A0A5C5XDQ2_9PLAN|nr:transposase [Rubinisphaera italica]TWT60938.1 Transposase [Rubinisphaera italica]